MEELSTELFEGILHPQSVRGDANGANMIPGEENLKQPRLRRLQRRQLWLWTVETNAGGRLDVHSHRALVVPGTYLAMQVKNT